MLGRCIAAENRKLRRAAVWAVFFAVPLISGVYGTYNFIQNQGYLHYEWYDLWTQHTLFYALFFFAPMIGIYAAYLWRLEHLGHNWNLLMTAPVRPICLFAAKLVTVLKMALLTQGWMVVVYLVTGKLWVGLPGWPPLEIYQWALRGALAAVPVICIQLLLSMMIRSFAIPVLIALGGGIAGSLLGNKGLGLLLPYSLMLTGMNSNKPTDALAGNLLPFTASCLLFTAVFLLAAQLFLTRRDVKT